ncbi:MAG: glycosyltransferase, partial [Myxococcota bacterium]|nr:glycosyltransferase [Myxococcota bacterium]
ATTGRLLDGVAPDLADTGCTGSLRVHRWPAVGTSLPGIGSFRVAPGLVAALSSLVRRAEVVHLHGVWTFPVAWAGILARGMHRPTVVTPHGDLQRWALQQKRWKKAVYLRTLGRYVLGGTAVMHFVSEREREESPDWARAMPGAVVPNAVDTGWIPEPPATQGAPVRTPVRIGIVGRLHASKGFDIAARAVAGLTRAHPARLVVCGDGDHRILEGLARDFERHPGATVEHVGERDGESLGRLYASLAVLVVPSRQEAFGMSIAEALAAGVPVVAAEGLGLAPWLRSQNLPTPPRDDIDRWVRELLRFCDSPAVLRRAAGAAGSVVRREWNPARIAPRMVGLYIQAAEHTRRTGAATG